jgi:hypothetical protein
MIRLPGSHRGRYLCSRTLVLELLYPPCNILGVYVTNSRVHPSMGRSFEVYSRLLRSNASCSHHLALSGYILCQNKLVPTYRWRLIDHIAVLGDPALSCSTGVETTEYRRMGFRGISVWTGPGTHTHLSYMNQLTSALQAYTLST